MSICFSRRGRRVACSAVAGCTAAIMTVSPGAARNGSCALAYVAPRKDAGVGILPSVRFMGRRVYAGLVAVLVSAMIHGLKPERVKVLREALKIDRRTLERWRQWWLGIFVDSSFWREARARFMPPLCQKTLPLSLCVSFEVERRDRLLDLLKFLAPITTPTAWKELVM